MTTPKKQAAVISALAEILRGSWKPYEYQNVILPLILLKRLDILPSTSTTDPVIQDILKTFGFESQLQRLKSSNILDLLLQELNQVDLSPKSVSNHDIGTIFEELIRKFNEQSSEATGEYYTPRDIITLMTRLLLKPDQARLTGQSQTLDIYDPCCGTGGMLTVSYDYIQTHINPQARIHLYGQELNQQTYAIAKTDLLLRGQDTSRIKGGSGKHYRDSTLTNDQFPGQTFDYVIANPPYGIDWKKDQATVLAEAALGSAGRFPGGVPQINDAQLLFLQHVVAKLRPSHEGGGRAAIIHNGSPLFTGIAGSGPSQIRRWLLENDMLEAIIALPANMFYNTGVATYIWLLTNRKAPARRGHIQLIDASSIFHNLPQNLGNKNKQLTDAGINQIYQLYANFTQNNLSKVLANTEFGYTQITVGHSNGRHSENIPLSQNINDYLNREIIPHLPGAHLNHTKSKIGYEIPFNRYFYQYTPPRPLEEINAELTIVTKQILTLLSR